jgi:ribonuclease Z
MRLTITGYSTALFATWYFIDEYGLLLDAGDGFMAALLHKSRKANHVFISHADRDHLTGLFQFNQLNARPGFPIMYYPKDSTSFPAMEAFSKAFDQHVSRTVWKPLAEGDSIFIKDNLYVEAIRNGHVEVNNNITKSLSYKVFETKRKLKPEWSHLPGEELRQLSLEKGKDSLTYEVRNCVIGYSGDTPVEDIDRWNNCRLLIHEATFLGGKEDVPLRKHGNRHSTLEEVMDMVSNIHIEQLILGHFSSRYSTEQIDRRILQLCDKYSINIPVFRILPGQTVSDILSQQAINR